MYAQFFMLFLLMGTGYFCRKVGIIRLEAHKTIYNLIVYLAFPALILNKLLSLDLAGDAMKQFLSVVALSIVTFTVLSLLGKAFLRLRKYPCGDGPDQSVDVEAHSSMLYPNNGFLGFPVVLAFYGADGLFLMISQNVVMSAMLYSICASAFHASQKDAGTFRENLPKYVRTIVTQPIVIASVVGVVLAACHVQFPALITDFISTLGSLSSGLTMLYIGSVLAGFPVKLPHSEVKPLIGVTLFKLVVFPAVAAVLSLIARSLELISPMVAVTLVLGNALPTAAMVPAFAEQTGHNARLASCMVLVNTALSMATIPLWVAISNRLFL